MSSYLYSLFDLSAKGPPNILFDSLYYFPVLIPGSRKCYPVSRLRLLVFLGYRSTKGVKIFLLHLLVDSFLLLVSSPIAIANSSTLVSFLDIPTSCRSNMAMKSFQSVRLLYSSDSTAKGDAYIEVLS